MFDRCDFLIGAGNSVVIVVPEPLPDASTYTVSVSSDQIKFKADDDDFAEVAFTNKDIFENIMHNTQVGLIEYDRKGTLPSYITNIAYVELRRA
jgi:hypothetical protein